MVIFEVQDGKEVLTMKDEPIVEAVLAPKRECPRCHAPEGNDDFNCPKCGAAFCGQCFELVLEDQSGSTMKCPECKTLLTFPQQTFGRT